MDSTEEDMDCRSRHSQIQKGKSIETDELGHQGMRDYQPSTAHTQWHSYRHFNSQFAQENRISDKGTFFVDFSDSDQLGDRLRMHGLQGYPQITRKPEFIDSNCDLGNYSPTHQNLNGFEPLFDEHDRPAREVIKKRKLSDVNKESQAESRDEDLTEKLQLSAKLVQRVQTLEDAAKACQDATNEANETTDHLYDSDGSKNQQQVNWDAFKFQVDCSGPTEMAEYNLVDFYQAEAIREESRPENRRNNLGFKSVSSDSGISTQMRGMLSQRGSHPNLYFQPFQPALPLQTKSISGNHSFQNNSPLNSESNKFYRVGSRLSQSSMSSMQTQRQNVSHKIHVSEEGMRECDYVWPDYPNDEEAKEAMNECSREPEGVTFQQLKEYDKLVIQLIKEQINQENRQRVAYFQQKQKQRDLESSQQAQKRNPFQVPKIFSKPRLPVTKSFSGKSQQKNQSSVLMRKTNSQPSLHAQNQQSLQGSQSCNMMQRTDPFLKDSMHKRTQGVQKQFVRPADKPQEFEEEEMIEEIIEIEESEEAASKEPRSSEENHLMDGSETYGTNIAGGGRGSIASMIDSNFLGQGQVFPFNAHLMDEESKSMQLDFAQNARDDAGIKFIQGDEGDDSLKMLYVQNQHSEAVSTFQVLHQPIHARMGSEIIITDEIGCCEIDSDAFEPRNLDLIFGNMEILTEHDTPFYAPRDDKTAKQVAHQHHKRVQANKAESQHNQSLVAMFNSSLIFENGGGNQSIQQLGSVENDDEPIEAQPRPQLDCEEEKKEGHYDYDDDIVNQNSSLEFSHRSSQANNLHYTGNRHKKCHCGQKKLHKAERLASSQTEGNRVQRKTSEKGGPQRFTYFSAASLSDDRWVCPICLDIFIDAVETPCCNNLFCERCILQTPNCPLCSKRIIDGLKPNIPIRRLVMELSIKCPNELCEQIIKRCEIDKHNSVCPYLPMQCPNNSFCGQILRRDLAHHCEYICIYRTVHCLLKCGQKMPLNQMDDHIRDACANTELQCRNRCGETILRGQMEYHINIECLMQPVACPNKGESLFEEGCNAVLRRKELDQHKAGCLYRRVVCQNHRCSSIIICKDAAAHDERCLFKIVECDNKCGQRTLRQHIQQHKEICEFQLVKCPYYELGCKIEVMRKDYNQHLMEEGFNHSVIFIEGQKRKNREIDDLKAEMRSLRQDYSSEVQWMYNEVNQLKLQMRQLRGSQDEQSNQAFDLYAHRSLPQSVQLRLHPHVAHGQEAAQIAPQKAQATNVFPAQNDNHNNFGGSRYMAGSERMSVTSASHVNQQADFPGLGHIDNVPSQVGLIDRPVTRRGRQTNTRLGEFSNNQPAQQHVVRVFNNQPASNFDSVLDGNSLDNIFINEGVQNQERPKVTYNNFFYRTFKQSSPQIEESPVVSNDQAFGAQRGPNSGPLSKDELVKGTKETCLRGISQINPLTAISNPNFSRKNRVDSRSNEDEDFGIRLRQERRDSLVSQESEVNLHNISSEHNEEKMKALDEGRESEEVKYACSFMPAQNKFDRFAMEQIRKKQDHQFSGLDRQFEDAKQAFGTFLQPIGPRKSRETLSPRKHDGKPPISGQVSQMTKTRLSTLARLSMNQNDRVQPLEPTIKHSALPKMSPISTALKRKADHDSSNVLYDEDFEANDDNLFN